MMYAHSPQFLRNKISSQFIYNTESWLPKSGSKHQARFSWCPGRSSVLGHDTAGAGETNEMVFLPSHSLCVKLKHLVLVTIICNNQTAQRTPSKATFKISKTFHHCNTVYP